MYKVLAIAREDLGAGFALSGIEVSKARDVSAAREALLSAIGSRQYGIVVIDGTFMSEFDERTKTIAAECNVPLVISVPGEMRWQDVEKVPRDDYVAQLIRRAVGYQLNIRL